MRTRTAAVAVVLLALAAVPFASGLTDQQCQEKYGAQDSFFNTMYSDQATYNNCTYLAIMGTESMYCKGCGDFPTRFKTACDGVATDGCSAYVQACNATGANEYSAGKLFPPLVDSGACSTTCRKHSTCDKCGADSACTWGVTGCTTTKFLTHLQATNELFKPGSGFYGCTWEAGKCFDYCDLSELVYDENFDYTKSSNMDQLKAKGISNFEISNQKASMLSNIGEEFAKIAMSEYSEEECEEDDNCEAPGESQPTAPAPSEPKVISNETPGKCKVTSDKPYYEMLFDDKPKPPAPQQEEITKDNMQSIIMKNMIFYQMMLAAGRMSEGSVHDLGGNQGSGDSQDPGQGGNQGPGNRRRLLEGDDEDDEDDEDDAFGHFGGCFEMIKDKEDCPADCKVNICSDPSKVATTKAFIEALNDECLVNEIKKKCGCPDGPMADAELAKLGKTGEQELPPVPMMRTMFATMDQRAGSSVKGSGTLLFYLSMIEYNPSTAKDGVFSGVASDIVQEIEFDKTLNFSTTPVAKSVQDADDSKKTGKATFFHLGSTVANDFKIEMKCVTSNVKNTASFSDRSYAVDWDTMECDIDWQNFPFKSSTSRIAIKTAVFAESFEQSLDDPDGDDVEDSITVGGVKLEFAKKVKYNNTKEAPVSSSAKNIDCGTIGWYTDVYKATTKRDMGFSELKCTYFSFMGAFDNKTNFSWDPKIAVDSTAEIAKSRAASGAAAPPKVVTKPPLKTGEVIAGVDKPDAAAAAPKTPVVKVKYAMPVKKFDAATSTALKSSFAKNIAGVEAKDIKITKASFDVKSTISFAGETEASFKTKEAAFKSALATDLSVSADKITVKATPKTRRHLLAGINVDYTVTGIESFETAKSMTTVANSPSAMKSVTTAVALPTVTSAGVEAQLEFEIVAADDTAAGKVATALADTTTLTKIANEVPDVKSAPKVVGEVTTVKPSPPPPPPAVVSGAPSSAKLFLMAVATLFASVVLSA